MPVRERPFFGHPAGLYLLFLVEMWERFSYYGMRALLVLYLARPADAANPGRGWSKEASDNLYGWYTGMAYLLPIVGGLIADRLIGTHRSLVIGTLLIALGHLTLAASGLGPLAGNDLGLSLFVAGLVLIVLGTGHFKPNVSVMIDQLYPAGDPRRDGGFTIFYMGINVGAMLGPLVCSLLGEKIGWHYGFGAAAVGMILGLLTYLRARPRYLSGIGDPPTGRADWTVALLLASIAIAATVAALYHFRVLAAVGAGFDALVALSPTIFFAGSVAAVVALAVSFVATQPSADRGPVTCILIFVLFNAVFWFAFEQAGSSLNHFADEMTDRRLFGWEVPAGWLLALGALMVVLLAPVFAGLWSALGRRGRNPGQPIKLALGLFALAAGYVFMVLGSLGTTPSAKAAMHWLVATYFLHTVGELCMSPTGLAFLTRVAPLRSVSLLMGIWYLANAVANKIGGQVAGQIEAIERGEVTLPWYEWFRLGGQADFFLFFVLISAAAGALVFALSPLLGRLIRNR